MKYLPAFLILLLCAPACRDDTAADEPAPLAPKQQEIKKSEKKMPTAMVFEVQSTDAKVTFEMEAPFERQDGSVPQDAISGELEVVLNDLTQSTGLINVDISDLVIYQQKAEEESQFGPREKSDMQNEHMRDWLEIGEDAPAEEVAKSKLVQFALKSIESPSNVDVTKMSGPERKITFTGVGEFRLHQRVSSHRVELEATFHYNGDTPVAVDVRTLKPLLADLEAHDVRPRVGFGKLAQKTLEAMAPKVAQEAAVTVAFTAKPQKLASGG